MPASLPHIFGITIDEWKVGKEKKRKMNGLLTAIAHT
jgi:hypothetical protein